MRRVHWFLAGLALAIGAGAMAQVVPGGLPSFPTFQGVTIRNGGASQNFSQLVLRADTSTVGSYLTFNNGATQKGVVVNERTAGSNCVGSSVDDFCFRSISGRLYGVDTSQSGQLAIESDSGALTWSFTTAQNPNCSAGGTNATVQLHRIGKTVVANVTGFGSCSSAGATTFSTNNAPVAAGWRPSASSSCGTMVGSNAGGNAVVSACVTSAGNFSVANLAGSTTLIGVLVGTFTYALD